MEIQQNASQACGKGPTQSFAASMTKLLIVALLAGCSAADGCESPLQVVMEDGKLIARFKIGDSSCSLIDDQMFCTPVEKSRSISWRSRL